MELQNMNHNGESLQISTEVIAKIAKIAALEVDGVAEVDCTTQSKVKEILEAVSIQNPVEVEMHDGTAAITVNLIVWYGVRIPRVAEKVQENIKSTVQNMTNVAVGSVNLVIAGVVMPAADDQV